MSKLLAGARWLLVTEWRMYVGAFRLLSHRSDVPPGSTPYPYVGAVSLALWAFTIVSAVELVALHLILPWESVRLAADVLGIWGVVWCLGMTGCHYVYPHLLGGDHLRVRNAHHTATVTVPWSEVASVGVRERSRDSSRSVQVDEDEQGRTLLHVPVSSRTNVELRLRRPITVTARGVEHRVSEIRLFADDPAALARTARKLLDAAGNEPDQGPVRLVED